MRRYPEYIETREELIGAVPQAWELVKMKHVAQIDNSGVWGEDQGILEFDVPVSTTAHLTTDGDWLIEKMPIRSFSKADHDYYSVKDGDIIVVKSSGSATNIITGKAGYIDNRSMSIVFSNFLMRVKANRDMYVPKLLYYFLTSSITKERIKRMVSATTYPNLKVEEYISNLIPMPSSKDEQVKIVTFLDHKTGQIDELIRIKERKKKLLQEQRTALINQAVTKGLNPNVELKPSGVEWIGEIPAHWEVLKVKHVGSSNPSKNNPKTHYLKDKLVVFLPMERVHTDGTFDQELKVPYSQLKNGYTYFEENDVLIAKVTPCFENGKIVLIKNLASQVGFGSTEFIVIRPVSRKVFPTFLYYVLHNDPLRSMGKYFMTSAVGLKRVPTKFVENFPIPVPSIQEQAKIADYLDRKILQIDELISEEQRSIELLKEYRQSLISDAVTGKIDVRNEV